MEDSVSSAPSRKALILILILVIIPLIGLGLYLGPKLLDTTPPVLTVNGLEPDKHYRGSLTLDIIARDEKSGPGSLTVQVDGAFPIPLNLSEEESTSWTLQTATLADGPHTVSVTATDRSLQKNRTPVHFSVLHRQRPTRASCPPGNAPRRPRQNPRTVSSRG